MKDNIPKNSKDLNSLTAILSILIGAIYWISAYSLPKATVGNPRDPSYFPLGLATILVICGVLLLAKSKFSNTVMALKAIKSMGLMDKKNIKLIINTCIICVIYSIIFNLVGFIISTFLFLEAVLVLMGGKKKIIRNTIVALGFSVGIYIIFNMLLGIILPPSPWF